MSPPLDRAAKPSFWSVLKDGRVKLSVEGPGKDFSAEASFGSGLRIGAGANSAGESLHFRGEGKIVLHSVRGDFGTNRGVEVISDSGAVLIRGNGADNVGGTVAPTDAGSSVRPGVTIESQIGVLIRSDQSVSIEANALNLQNVTNLNLRRNSALSLQSGDTISQSSKTRDTTSMGKSSETYTGPKDGLPTNGAVHEVTIATTPATGFVGGPADTYAMIYGDKLELIAAGNHISTVAVGTRIYAVGTGSWTASAGPNLLAATPAGVTVAAGAGVASLTAAAGATTVSGSAAVSVVSAGPVVIRGTVVTLVAPSPKIGPIICATDLDPTSGLPFGFFLMGSPTHLLSAG
jgi:hypothetical protein